MKCKNCGTEFYEGVFCPECGTKYEDESVIVIGENNINNIKESEVIEPDENMKMKLELEKEKTEQERISAERQIREYELALAREKTEQERIAFEREKAAKVEKEINDKLEEEKQKKLEEQKREDQEYQERLAIENRKINNLKNEMLAKNNQKYRREKFYAFQEELTCSETRKRYNQLKDKVDQDVPIGEIKCRRLGYSALACFCVAMLLMLAGEIANKQLFEVLTTIVGWAMIICFFACIVTAVKESRRKKREGDRMDIKDI